MKRVLLIDDAETIHLYMRSILSEMNMELVSAYSGDDLPPLAGADQSGAASGFDLIIIDVTLQTDRDGIPLAERIAESVTTPIVFLTASDDQETMKRISRLTHYGIILKSSNSFVIAESVRMAFRLHETHRKQIDHELRYHSLVETIQEIVLIHDDQGTIEYINRHGADTLGQSPDSLVGTSAGDIFERDYLVRSRLLADSHGKESDRSFDMVSSLTDRSGRKVTVGVRSSPVIRNGQYFGELVAARDISQSEADRTRLEHLNRLLLSIREVHTVLIRSTSSTDLIQEVCDVLVSNGAYSSAWIILDPWESDDARRAGAAGIVDSGRELLRVLGDHEPRCTIPTDSAHPHFATCSHPAAECPHCPLHTLYGSNASMSAHLHYAGHTFGVITVAVDQQRFRDVDVQQIFVELAADLSFALHSLMQKYFREQAEADALAQQRQLQTFSDYSPMSIVTVDRNGVFVEGNPYFHRWTGYGADDLLHTNFRELLRERSEDLDSLFSSTDYVTSEASRNVALSLRATNGDPLWGEGVIVPIPADSGREASMVIVLADTTPRHVAEQRLRHAHHELHRSEVRYQSLFRDSSDLVFVSSADGTLIEINDAGAKMLGYSAPEDLIGVSVDRFYAQPSARQNFLDEITRNEFVKNHEIVLRTKSGELLFGSESATVVRGSAGEADTGDTRRLFQGVIHDVTERIRSEQESIRRSMELSKANEDLRQAQNELVKREKLASIGELSAGVAHEINNPLGFVRSNFSMLRKYVERYQPFFAAYRDLPPPKPEVLQQVWEEQRIERTLSDIGNLFHETEDGVQRIVSIVSNLKDFSRAGNSAVMDDYNINHGIESTLVIAKNEYKYVADVRTEPGEVATVACNANEINQVLLTLIVNAAQAIESWKSDRGTIAIRTWQEAGTVCCSITDDGPGIPADVQSRIFEPFFTTKKAGEGTGLGLSIAYDIIVNRHGGTMRLHSTEGEGATFTLKIPGRGYER